MQKVLRKRIFRDFKENLPRYLALAFLLILSMYMVVSVVGAADTVMRGTTTEAENFLLQRLFPASSPAYYHALQSSLLLYFLP